MSSKNLLIVKWQESHNRLLDSARTWLAVVALIDPYKSSIWIPSVSNYVMIQLFFADFFSTLGIRLRLGFING